MNASDSWPHSEQDIVDRWDQITSDDVDYFREIPVHHDRPGHPLERARGTDTTKWVDIVVVEGLTDEIIRRTENYAQKNGVGIEYNAETGNMERDEQGLFVATVEAWPYSTMSVRLIEAKQKLSFKAVGQVASYSEVFEQYHRSHSTAIEVVDSEIIYHYEDDFIRNAAESMGITCTQIHSPKQRRL